MKTTKNNKPKEKLHVQDVIKLSPPMTQAVAGEPRFILRFIGREQVSRFSVPVVLVPRHD